MNLPATIANSLWLASNIPALVRFQRALRCPAETQLQLLRALLSRNANCAHGQAHGFSQIKNYQEFAARVPLNDYEALQPWMERVRHGAQRELTSEAVTQLIPTSGSSAARKLIPFTASLQREFDSAIGPWIADIYRQHPDVMLGPAYWSISPAVTIKDRETSVVPIGFEDDSAYLGGVKKRLVNAVMAVPAELRLVSDMEQFRYLTLLCLLRQKDLRLISIWHPSYLSLLLDALPAFFENLLDDIRTGQCRYADVLPANVLRALKLRPLPFRAKELKDVNPNHYEAIWPRLKMISCWGDANAAYGLAELQRRFPGVRIQPKGLIATEAIVTIPFCGRHPLAIGSHFFEFIDEQNSICLAHELQKDKIYEVVVTNGAGLWRYRLKDLVQVTDFIGQTPSLCFLGRSENVSDRFGEKLSEVFVTQAIQFATSGLSLPPRFTLLAPDEDGLGCRYILYLEGEIQPGLVLRLEAALLENPHYAWCRKLGQLQPANVFQIGSNAYKIFVADQLAHGKKLGEIKPCSLSVRTGWTKVFANK
ncbi:MAG TPA: GH3 auxin-responsive promoter family protein [Verrucomicrobiae bacterium]|jgi:hypothetical protein